MTRRALLGVSASLLLLPAAAHAHGAERAVFHHPDALPGEQGGFARMSGFAPSTLPATWCGDVTAQDRGTIAPASFKILYVHGSDRPNRLAEQGTLIQKAISETLDIYKDASNNTLVPRMDMGSSCGDQHLDILSMQLARPIADYRGISTRPTMLAEEIGNAAGKMGLRPDTNVLAFVDGAGDKNSPVTGEAQLPIDDRPDPKVNDSATGGLFAFVYGFDERTSDPYNGTLTAAHELTHTLGAVQKSAPHSTPAGHCFDEYDLMCYQDGQDVKLTTVCPGSAQDVGELDCGRDDYFSLNPAAGSYLANHWNIASSPFLCDPATCAVADPDDEDPTPDPDKPATSKPGKVSGVKMVRNSTKKVTVLWKKRPNGEQVEGYEVGFKGIVLPPKIKLRERSGKVFADFTGLPRKRKLSINVRAKNDLGFGKKSKQITFKTK